MGTIPRIRTKERAGGRTDHVRRLARGTLLVSNIQSTPPSARLKSPQISLSYKAEDASKSRQRDHEADVGPPHSHFHLHLHAIPLLLFDLRRPVPPPRGEPKPPWTRTIPVLTLARAVDIDKLFAPVHLDAPASAARSLAQRRPRETPAARTIRERAPDPWCRRRLRVRRGERDRRRRGPHGRPERRLREPDRHGRAPRVRNGRTADETERYSVPTTRFAIGIPSCYRDGDGGGAVAGRGVRVRAAAGLTRQGVHL